MNYYKLLGIQKDATSQQISTAYRNLIKAFHPDFYSGDKTFAETKSAELNRAYSILKDEEKRRHYDEWLELNEEPDDHNSEQWQQYEDTVKQKEEWNRKKAEHNRKEEEWGKKQEEWRNKEEQHSDNSEKDHKQSNIADISIVRKILATISFWLVLNFGAAGINYLVCSSVGYYYDWWYSPKPFIVEFTEYTEFAIAAWIAIYILNFLTKNSCAKLCMINTIIGALYFCIATLIGWLITDEMLSLTIGRIIAAIVIIIYAVKFHRRVYTMQ